MEEAAVVVPVEKKKRKRAPHNSACWECYRSHRACDGSRPCKRCISLDKAADCRDPPAKQKLPKRRDESTYKAPRNHFFIVEPESFHSPRFSYEKIPIFTPSNLHVGLAPIPIAPALHPLPVMAEPTGELPLIVGLLDQVKQLNEATRNLQETQNFLKQQISVMNQTNTQSNPSMQGSIKGIPAQTRIMVIRNDPQPQELMQQVIEEIDELEDLPREEISQTQSTALTIPHDTRPFRNSVFIPFAVKDSAQVPISC